MSNPNLQILSNKDLKELLRERDLSVGGKKAVLISRLVEWEDKNARAEKKDAAESDAVAPAVNMKKLYIRGSIGCVFFLTLLFGVGVPMRLTKYVAVALAVQLFVYFFHALPNDSEMLYDLTGAATHLALMLASLLSGGRRVRSERQLFVAVGSALWLSRLGAYLYGRIVKDGIDHRFTKLKKSYISFLVPWLGQAVWTTFIQLPVILLNDVEDPAAAITALDCVGIAAWFVGFAVEVVADTQKAAFRANSANKQRYITTGIWRYSRHPNYFGEILMWSAMALIASGEHLAQATACATGGSVGGGVPGVLSCVGAALGVRVIAAWISPAFTAFLLIKVSGVSMLEPLGMKKWGDDPAYVHYMEHTSCIIPWRPAPVQDKRVR